MYWLRLAQERAERYFSPFTLFEFILVVTLCVICIYFSFHILCYLYLFQLSPFTLLEFISVVTLRLFVFISVVTFCVLSVSNDVLNVRVPYGCSCHNATNDNKQVCMCTVVIITEL